MLKLWILCDGFAKFIWKIKLKMLKMNDVIIVKMDEYVFWCVLDHRDHHAHHADMRDLILRDAGSVRERRG